MSKFWRFNNCTRLPLYRVHTINLSYPNQLFLFETSGISNRLKKFSGICKKSSTLSLATILRSVPLTDSMQIFPFSLDFSRIPENSIHLSQLSRKTRNFISPQEDEGNKEIKRSRRIPCLSELGTVRRPLRKFDIFSYNYHQL